jgi:hypothetical protein
MLRHHMILYVGKNAVTFLHASARKRAILWRHNAEMYTKDGNIKMNEGGV